MTIYLGDQPLAGLLEPLACRSIGEIISSTLPLTDAGLHLLDGSVLSGGGIYHDFVDYIANLYNENPTASYFTQPSSYTPFVQPVLTSNGTMGGDACACDCSSTEGASYAAYKAFDDDISTRWGSSSISVPDWLTFYSPIPLKVSSVYLDFYAGSEIYSAGEIQGSNDNSTWTTLTSFSENSSVTLTLPITTNEYYKYIRFYGTALSGSGWGKVAEMKITATTGVQRTAEDQWQAYVNQYGVCGKFVYDPINNTVRLPKVEGFAEGTVDPTILGNLTEAGLPNIQTTQSVNTGSTTSLENLNGGCLYSTTKPAISTGGAQGRDIPIMTSFDASRCNSIYGNSSTVQPQSIKVLYYIVVATVTKTDIEVDIDEIVTDLAGKADVDLTNVNNSGTSRGASWAIPSNTYVDLTLGASGSTYTAPANGYIAFCKITGSSSKKIGLINTSNGLQSVSSGYSTELAVCLPVLKGTLVTLQYDASSGTTKYFRFIYAKGSESEAS